MKLTKRFFSRDVCSVISSLWFLSLYRVLFYNVHVNTSQPISVLILVSHFSISQYSDIFAYHAIKQN